MSSQRSASSGDDWRRTGASSERRASGPKWRRQLEARSPRRVRRTRALKVAGASLALGILGGLLIWVSTWLWPPKPASLVLVGAGYEQNLAIPHNAYGRKSLQMLADQAVPANAPSAWGSGRLRLEHGPLTLTGDTRWDSGLTQFEGRTLVLFLALHGGSDQDGAYLLTDDADARPIARNRLRLTAVLDRLAQLPSAMNKVLILDATQIQSDWTLGMIHNDFARKLAALEPRVLAIPRLVVLSASDVDQRSWSCDSLGQTIFAATLIEGLQGAAANKDSRIDAEALFLHVTRQVERWVGINLQERQTPVLIPAGETGKKRARAIELCGAAGLSAPRAQSRDHELESDKGLTAWRDFQRLREVIPSPTIHLPHKWRLYKETLIRHDELLRAGAVVEAGELALDLNQLVLELGRPLTLDLSSIQGTLTMGVIEGQEGAGAESLRHPFEKLWEASSGNEVKLWQQLQATAGRTLNDLRWGLLDLLIQRVADDPAHLLDRGVRLARVLVDPTSPPPVEVQELIMMARDIPRENLANPGLSERVSQAIRVRRLAEQSALLPADPTDRGRHPYVSHVLPWVRTRVDEADELRRQGLDLLFASDPSEWDRCGDLLQRAERIYQDVQDDAGQVRDAYGIRDEVLEALPDYSLWLGRIRPYGQRVRNVRLDELEASVTTLWDSTHALVATLEKGDPRSIRHPLDGDSPSTDLVSLTASVRGLFQKVGADFDSYVRAIEESDLGILWPEIRIAISVPFDDLRMRQRLMASLARIERRFLVKDNNGKFDSAPAITEASNRSRVIQRGQIQGLMALGVLGQNQFDSTGSTSAEQYGRVRGQLARLQDDPSWSETLRGIGTQIGECSLQMPVAIDRAMAEGLSAADPRDRTVIEVADRLWRQLDGALPILSTANPSKTYRSILLRDILLWQAGRTLADHWYSEDPALEPYFRTAGLRFVDDARQLDPRPLALRTSAKAAQTALERPGQFGFQGPARLVLTSEKRIEVEYRLQPDPSLPASSGYPVVWFDPGRELQSLVPEAGRRIAQAIGPKPEAPILCTFASARLNESEASPPPTPRVEHSTCGAYGLFRGQRFSLETAIDLHLVPEQVVGRHPVPVGASLSVRAQDAVLERLGTSSGAIAIVLDCSGSMGPAAGQAWGPSTKYREATQALRQVLQGLTKGTVVSVWVFGQAVGFEKTVKDAERTITRIQDPMTWDPGDPGQLKQLMDRVEYPALEPWNESPIVRTMLRARDDLRNVPGFKTLLVLTDGMDNRYEEDTFANPHKTPIPVAIRALFKDSGIEVNIVGYKVVSPEAERARAQFRVIEELPIPGKFYEVNDAAHLAGVLGKAMGRRLRYWVEEEDNVLVPGTPSEGLTTSRVGANDRWFAPALAPGGFKLVIDPLRRQTRNIALNNGDLLIVQLDPARVGVDFRRIEFSREDFSWKPATEKNGWRLAVLQNQLLGTSSLQMLCTLEKAFSRFETSLSVVRPREVWYELEPLGNGEVPFSMRWSNRSGYPAAAWTLDVSRWPSSPGTPSPARPILRCWWNPDQDTPASAGLDRGPDFDLDTGRAANPVPVEGDHVTVESVRVEDHRVEISHGAWEIKSCLVVRLGHSPGKPIAVRPVGLVPAGSEQRFYTSAAKTTALFWPVTRDEAGAMLTGLKLFSVNTFKAQAERRGFSTEIRDLPIPRPDDVPPQEVPIQEVGVSVMPFE
ncbi:vWA domain-containing protein [Singulisphaera sp. Ch08]|uniref:VWA domain-containing protein n=1 Tax=Singulisphaera sp. Ch08 TaxID=3120278 RepID=A0AAU7CBS0_9BACT